MSSFDVVVLGGGPAGLGAAWRAALAGRSVTVIERAPELGGMAASFDVCGMRVDNGSHRLHRAIDPTILTELRHLLGDDLQERVRHGRLRLADRWIHFPLKTTNLLRNMPARLSAGIAKDAVLGPLRSAREDTFAEVVRAGLGPTMLREFYGPYAMKLWGYKAEQLAGEQARRRIKASRPTDIVRKLAKQSGTSNTFLYPKQGFGQIVDVMGAAAADAGTEIQLDTAATSISLQEDSSKITLSNGEIVTGEHIWSTIPLPVLARLCGAPTPRTRLQHRSMVLLYLALDRKQWTEFDADYFPSLDTTVSRVSEPKNYRDSKDDPSQLTVLCAEIPCAVDDEIWNATDNELAERVRDDFARYGLPEFRPVHVEVKRLATAYPIYRPGFEEGFAELDDWASQHSNLLTFGRLGLFAHDNTHHALAMAWAAAETLDDPSSWTASRERFRSHVVED